MRTKRIILRVDFHLISSRTNALDAETIHPHKRIILHDDYCVSSCHLLLSEDEKLNYITPQLLSNITSLMQNAQLALEVKMPLVTGSRITGPG